MVILGSEVRKRGQDAQLCIFFQGLRGSGKSSLCRVVESVLDYTAVRLDADDLQQGPGAQTQRGQLKFQEKVLNMLDEGTQILLVDSLPLNADVRKAFLIAVRETAAVKKTVILVLVKLLYPGDGDSESNKEKRDIEELRLCFTRVSSRGDNHFDPAASGYDAYKYLEVALRNRCWLNDWERKLFEYEYTVNMTESTQTAAEQLLKKMDGDKLLDLSLKLLTLEKHVRKGTEKSRSVEMNIGKAELCQKPVRPWRQIIREPLSFENMNDEQEWLQILSGNLPLIARKLGCANKEVFLVESGELQALALEIRNCKDSTKVDFGYWIRGGPQESQADKTIAGRYEALFKKYSQSLAVATEDEGDCRLLEETTPLEGNVGNSDEEDWQGILSDENLPKIADKLECTDDDMYVLLESGILEQLIHKIKVDTDMHKDNFVRWIDDMENDERLNARYRALFDDLQKGLRLFAEINEMKLKAHESDSRETTVSGKVRSEKDPE